MDLGRRPCGESDRCEQAGPPECGTLPDLPAPALCCTATGQDNWTLDVSPVNTLAASIFTWLTPFTGQGMNKSRLVLSRGTLAKKRTST